MLLPGLEHACIDCRKLTGYALDPSHPEGRHKARVFRSALGLTAADSEWLATAILAGLREYDAMWQSETSWGPIYRVDMEIVRGQRCAMLRTAWLCAPDSPRLLTCFVMGECDETA